MKQKTRYIINNIITFISIAIVIITLLYNYERPLDIQCVSTEKEALKIGEIICTNVYPQFDYSKYEWECLDAKDIWIVFCSSGAGVLGRGGLPEVHIKKNNAEVIFIGLTV